MWLRMGAEKPPESCLIGSLLDKLYRLGLLAVLAALPRLLDCLTDWVVIQALKAAWNVDCAAQCLSTQFLLLVHVSCIFIFDLTRRRCPWFK